MGICSTPSPFFQASSRTWNLWSAWKTRRKTSGLPEGRTQQSIDIVRWRWKAASVEGRRSHRSHPGAWPRHPHSRSASKNGPTIGCSCQDNYEKISCHRKKRRNFREIHPDSMVTQLGQDAREGNLGVNDLQDLTIGLKVKQLSPYQPRQPSPMWLWFEAQKPDGLFLIMFV